MRKPRGMRPARVASRRVGPCGLNRWRYAPGWWSQLNTRIDSQNADVFWLLKHFAGLDTRVSGQPRFCSAAFECSRYRRLEADARVKLYLARASVETGNFAESRILEIRVRRPPDMPVEKVEEIS